MGLEELADLSEAAEVTALAGRGDDGRVLGVDEIDLDEDAA